MATILRSSKYVRSFTELANKLGKSKSKADLSLNFIYKSCSSSNSSTTTFTRSLATQLAVKNSDDSQSKLETSLQRLDADVKRLGRISKSRVERILNTFMKTKSVSSTQALMIIRCCGNLIHDELPESRSELVNEIWKSIESSGVQLDVAHYNALLRVYIENNYAFSPAEVLADLERKGIKPNKLTYQRLISRYCELGDIEGASKILEFMKDNEIPVNENIFAALVKGHAVANDMRSAADLLTVMRQAGLEPSADTYKELLCGYAKHGDMDSITKTFSECKSNNIQLLDTDYLDIINSLATNGHSEHIETILALMPKEVGYIQDSLSKIVKLAKSGHIDAAKQILNSIPKRVNGRSAPSAIKQLAKCDLPAETLLDMCKEIESKGINSNALLIALESTLIEGKVEASLALIDALHQSGKEIREHYFWPVFVALGRSKDDSAMKDILRSMQTKYGLSVSSETLRDYVMISKTGDPDEILADLSVTGLSVGILAAATTFNLIIQSRLRDAAQFCKKYVFRYNLQLFPRALATALAQTGDAESYVAILNHVYQNRFNVKNEYGRETQIHNNILEPFIIEAINTIKDDKIAILSKVFEEIPKAGLNFNESVYNSVQRAIGNEMTSDLQKLLNRLKYRRGINTFGSETNYRAEIERLETSLKESTITNDKLITTKKRLLNLYSLVQDFPNLERIERELKELGVPFNETMYKQLLDGYLESNFLDKVDEYLRCVKLTNPNFELNDTKSIKYVARLIENDRTEDAIKFLQEQTAIQKGSQDKNIHWKILNSLADLGKAEALNEVFDMFFKNEYILISNPYLGPLVKVHVVRGDLKEALNVFEKLCETYQLTPYKNELAKKFIETEDAISLQKLTDLSTQVHGEANSLYDLAQSFIEMDCIRQAKKIIEIPALQQKVNKLISTSKRFRDQNQTVYLERLISVINDVPHLKIIPEFWNNLLHCYALENNWEQGLNLYKKMLDEDVEPSQVFLGTLAKLLIKNGKNIPYKLTELSDDVKRNIDASFEEKTQQRSLIKNDRNNRRDKNVGNNIESEKRTEKGIGQPRVIEALILDGKIKEAYELVISMIDDNKRVHKNDLKFLLRKLSVAGDIESIENLSKKWSIPEKKILDLENEVCRAHIEAGKIDEYLDRLEKHYETKYDDESERTVAELPTVGLRIIFQRHPEFIERYKKFAEKCAANGFLQPMNVLWIHYFTQSDPEGDKIWSEYMIDNPKVQYHSILRVANQKKRPELMEDLLKLLETAKHVNDTSKGYVYSELIKHYYSNNDVERSIETLRRALKSLSPNDLQRYCVAKLQGYLQSKGHQLPSDIVEKLNATENKPDVKRL